MYPTRADQLRESAHPVYNDRRLRLGTFSTNLSGGASISTIDGTLNATWPETMSLAMLAESMDFEALVPVGRWRGFGGVTDFNGSGFECFSWAAGVGALTERPGVFVTSHVPTVHPVMAAKQMITIDHITQGRAALNVVAGWYTPEIEMFGAPQLPHDERYDCAQEWIDIVKRMWTAEEPFSYEGRYYSVRDAVAAPGPVQSPHPVVMNAGGSPRGRHFGARNSDVIFALTEHHDETPAAVRPVVETHRRFAREEYGREVRVWINAYVVQGDTEADARAFLHHYVDELGDREAVANLLRSFGVNSESVDPALLEGMKHHFMAGWGGFPVVGTAERIVDTLGGLADAGLDGVLLTFPRYIQDMTRFRDEVHPLLVAAGLR